MRDPTINQVGFTLWEVLLATSLLALVVLALSGAWRGLVYSGEMQSQSREAWRRARVALEHAPQQTKDGWQISRVETSIAECVSITATAISPAGKTGRLERVDCPAAK